MSRQTIRTILLALTLSGALGAAAPAAGHASPLAMGAIPDLTAWLGQRLAGWMAPATRGGQRPRSWPARGARAAAHAEAPAAPLAASSTAATTDTVMGTDPNGFH